MSSDTKNKLNKIFNLKNNLTTVAENEVIRVKNPITGEMQASKVTIDNDGTVSTPMGFKGKGAMIDTVGLETLIVMNNTQTGTVLINASDLISDYQLQLPTAQAVANNGLTFLGLRTSTGDRRMNLEFIQSSGSTVGTLTAIDTDVNTNNLTVSIPDANGKITVNLNSTLTSLESITTKKITSADNGYTISGEGAMFGDVVNGSMLTSGGLIISYNGTSTTILPASLTTHLLDTSRIKLNAISTSERDSINPADGYIVRMDDGSLNTYNSADGKWHKILTIAVDA